MAETNNNETIGELFVRLGLNADELNGEYVQIQRTLRENLGRINRERNIINLQAQVDLTGLDESADATRILEIRQRSLQRQIENQRARLNLLRASLADVTENTGATSDATQRAQIAFEQARLSVARLESQLENLQETQEESGEGLEGIASSFVDFAKDFNPAINALQTFIDWANLAAQATIELINKFRELQTMSFKLNLPIDRAENFLQQIRLAGGEIEDLMGYVRGFTDAIVKGEIDDPEWIAYQKFKDLDGAIFDATGRLKDFQAVFEELRKAYNNAKDAGQEIEFLQMTGGESGVTDAIQAFNQWNQALEDAGKIAQANIDYESLRKADRQLSLLTEQAGEFTDALYSIFEPAVTRGIQNLFNIFHDGTEILVDNRKEIQKASAALFEGVATALNLKPFKRVLFDQQSALDKANEIFENSKRLDNEWRKLRHKQGNDPLSQYGAQRVKEFKDELEDLRLEIDLDSDYQKAVAEAELWKTRELRDKLHVSDQERAAILNLFEAKIEQAEKDHKDKLDDLWKETAKIQFDSTHSAFESQIRDIEEWKNKALEDLGEFKDAVGDKNKWLQESAAITANALAKEADAFEQEIDRIKGKTQSLLEKIFEQTHSQYAIDIMRAQKQRQEYHDEGIYPAELIEEWYQREIARLKKRAKNDGDYTKYEDLGRALPRTDYFGKIQEQLEAYQPQFEAKLKSQVEAIADFSNFSTQMQEAAQSISQIPAAIQNLQLAPLQFPPIVLPDFSQLIEPFKFSVDIFTTATDNASIALTDLTVSLQDATEQINNQIKNIFSVFTASPKEKNALPDKTKIEYDSPLDFAEKLKLAAAKFAGKEIENPRLPAADSSSPVYSGGDLTVVLQQLSQTQEQYLPQIVTAMQPLNQMTQELASLTQTAGTIAQTVSQRQPPTINLTNNIQVDLGGAYVFDNAMKSRLTDDITAEVTNAITDAVNKGVNRQNYGYGN